MAIACSKFELFHTKTEPGPSLVFIIHSYDYFYLFFVFLIMNTKFSYRSPYLFSLSIILLADVLSLFSLSLSLPFRSQGGRQPSS